MGDTATTGNRSIRAAAVPVVTAGTAIRPFAAIAAEKPAAAKPKPAIELDAPFADNAILQRQMPVPVWGWSKPGSKMTVVFAGQTRSAAADKTGKWMVKLDPLSPERPGGRLRT
jgi:hypothetical protein